MTFMLCCISNLYVQLPPTCSQCAASKDAKGNPPQQSLEVIEHTLLSPLSAKDALFMAINMF